VSNVFESRLSSSSCSASVSISTNKGCYVTAVKTKVQSRLTTPAKDELCVSDEGLGIGVVLAEDTKLVMRLLGETLCIKGHTFQMMTHVDDQGMTIVTMALWRDRQCC
jgi:hypothetical protein